MTNPNFWNQFLVWPIVNVLIGFYKLMVFLHVPGPLGFAIIFLTLVIRLILYPLMTAQLKSAKKMAALKPHLDALAAKHKDDKQKLQQAQMALYKEHGINPAAGCLPSLIQLPVLIALYSVFNQVLANGNLSKVIADINHIVYSPILQVKALDLNFFGINLGVKPAQFQTYGWFLLAIPVITAALQWYQTKLMMPTVASTQPTALPDDKKEKKEDTAAEMQKQMAMIMPIMFGYFAFQFPIGLALYWNVFGIFGIIQQLAINKQK